MIQNSDKQLLLSQRYQLAVPQSISQWEKISEYELRQQQLIQEKNKLFELLQEAVNSKIKNITETQQEVSQKDLQQLKKLLNQKINQLNQLNKIIHYKKY